MSNVNIAGVRFTEPYSKVDQRIEAYAWAEILGLLLDQAEERGDVDAAFVAAARGITAWLRQQARSGKWSSLPSAYYAIENVVSAFHPLGNALRTAVRFAQEWHNFYWESLPWRGADLLQSLGVDRPAETLAATLVDARIRARKEIGL